MSKGRFIGWKGITINEGKFVAAEDGFEYVCHHFGIEGFDETATDAEELIEMLVEWYFSGNWIEVYESGDEV